MSPRPTPPTWFVVTLWVIASLVVAALGYTVFQALLGDHPLESGFGLAGTVALTSGSALAVGMVFASALGWPPDEVLPLGPSRGRFALAVAVGAYPLGVMGDGLARAAQAALEAVWDAAPDAANIEMIVAAITEGPWVERVVFGAMVALIGPVLEELVFRGFLWRTVDGDRRPVVGLAVTTILFALWHGEVAQSVGTLPLGAFLGLVRWRTGSLRLCILAHCINNAAAVAIVAAGLWGPTGPIELVTSIVVGVGAFAWVTRRVD